MAGQFRSSQWDPVLIVAQIVAMQCLFYVGLGLFTAIVDFVVGATRSLDQLFIFQMLHFSNFHGKLLMVVSISNAFLGGIGLWYIVQRTKQCWDFAATVYLIHAFVCIVVNGYFPTTASWWLTTVIGAIIMTVLGEFLCMRTEMKAIPLSVTSKVDL